jgi:pyridoxine kinase
MYVLPGLPELMRDRVVPAADVVTPNAYELAFLSAPAEPGAPASGVGSQPVVDVGRVGAVDGLLEAVAAVRARGPRTVLVTSVEGTTHPRAGSGSDVLGGPTEIAMVAVDDSGAYVVRTPRLPISVNGAGDVTAALFLAHLSEGIETALVEVASSVFAILDATARSASREIQLVQAQDAIAAPPCEFEVHRLA